MIQKVLIAEDHESANISVQKTLEALQIFQPDYVYHCDDAALKIKKALQAGDPYHLHNVFPSSIALSSVVFLIL